MKYPRGTPLASIPTPEERILPAARSTRVANHAAFSLTSQDFRLSFLEFQQLLHLVQKSVELNQQDLSEIKETAVF